MKAVEPDLSEASIRQTAGPGAEHCAVHVFDAVPSTNSWLVEHGRAGEASLCVAERQMAGRGRRGRQWQSDGGGFTCSVRLPLRVSPAEAGAFSLVAALTLRDAVSALGVEGVGVKWPNDLLHEGRKLSGLLLEVARSDAASIDVVCGAGVNWQPLSQNVDQAYTDVHSLAPGIAHDRNRLAGYWLAALLEAGQRYEREGFKAFDAVWQAHDIVRNAAVTVLRGDQRIDGVARGVDSSGALRVETEQGMQLMHAGEVSLRRR